MGHPKGLLTVDGEPLLLLQIAAFFAAGLQTRVVLGAHAARYRQVLPPHVPVVENPEWATTDMAASVRIGMIGLGTVILTPVDVPPARVDTLGALVMCNGDAVPTFNGESGHPVRLTTPLAAGERLDARLASAQRVAVSDPDCVRNLNTPSEWEAWRRSVQRPVG
jgi:CTP:molybdopterin cytidylyltransferase MocA